jgi:hypothetical protein
MGLFDERQRALYESYATHSPADESHPTDGDATG